MRRRHFQVCPGSPPHLENPAMPDYLKPWYDMISYPSMRYLIEPRCASVMLWPFPQVGWPDAGVMLMKAEPG